MAEWGNGEDIQADVDMEPNGNYKLKVDINRDCNAIEAGNSHANGRALLVNGKSEFNGDLLAGNGDMTIDSELHVMEKLYAEADTLLTEMLTCESDVVIEGNLTVGPADATGDIDSGGSAGTPQKLRIGNGDGTDNILLSRSGKTVAFKGLAQMNSNGIVMNNASSVASGTGFIFNSEGHNGGGASIDVYTGGVLRGWIDSNGFVNA